MEKNKIVVNFYNKEYTIVGAESTEYLQEIARFVEEKIRKIGLENDTLSATQISTYACLMIADELFKSREEVSRLKNTLDSPNYALSNLKKELDVLVQENAKKAKLYHQTVEKILRAIEEAEEEGKTDMLLSKRVMKLEESIRLTKSNLSRKNRRNQISMDELKNTNSGGQ